MGPLGKDYCVKSQRENFQRGGWGDISSHPPEISAYVYIYKVQYRRTYRLNVIIFGNRNWCSFQFNITARKPSDKCYWQQVEPCKEFLKEDKKSLKRANRAEVSDGCKLTNENLATTALYYEFYFVCCCCLQNPICLRGLCASILTSYLHNIYFERD